MSARKAGKNHPGGVGMCECSLTCVKKDCMERNSLVSTGFTRNRFFFTHLHTPGFFTHSSQNRGAAL